MILRRFLQILDIFLALAIILILTPLAVVFIFINQFRLRRPSADEPQVLLTVLSGSSKVNAKRNIEFIYEASALNGYFRDCYFLYYLADEPLRFNHSPQIHIIDFRSLRATRLKKFNLELTSWVLQELAFLVFSYRLIVEKQVTMLQANDPYIQGFNTLVLSLATRVPFVVKIMCDYDHYFENFQRPTFPILKFRWLEKAIERLVYAFAHGITAWNENYMRYAKKSGAHPKKSTIVPTLVDIRFFEPAKPLPLLSLPFRPEEHDTVFYLGRLSWDKYCLDLVDCLAFLRPTFPKIKLVVLGDGELRSAFEERAAGKGVTQNIYLPGIQSIEQIISWSRICKCMLATHAGFSLIEMGALAVPVVAYHYEWHSELIEHEKTGMLVPFRDAKAMADATSRILDQPRDAQRMAQALQEKVFRECHPQVTQKKMQAFFTAVHRATQK